MKALVVPVFRGEILKSLKVQDLSDVWILLQRVLSREIRTRFDVAVSPFCFLKVDHGTKKAPTDFGRASFQS